MTSLNLGSNFNTSSVTDMSHMFANCGYTAMTSLTLGSKFNTSSVTNMSYMFYTCGRVAMTSLDLGDKFDTSKVENMRNMFTMCGQSAMTSLNLGDKFDTGSVTDMTDMFSGCGTTAMTTLELGPKFKNIASTYTDFADDLGKSGCIIFCTNDIYSSLHAFKLSSSSSTTIAYDRGYINPTSDGHTETTKPTWASNISDGTYNSSAKTYALNLVGSDETGLNDSSSTLSSSKVTVKVGNSTVSSSNLTFGTATISDDHKTKTFPLTIKNFTGGTVSITISSGALVDTSGNSSSSKTYSFTVDGTAPTWADSVSNGTYSSSGKTYALNLVGSDETGLNTSSSTLSTSNVTVKVGGTSVNTSNLTFGSTSLSSDSKTKTFPLTIKNYTGGSISITIKSGALVDTAGNTSAEKTYSFTPDTTAPTWANDVSGGTWSTSAKTYKLNLVGSDETGLNSSSSTLVTSGTSQNLTVKVGGTTVSSTNLTLGTATLSSDSKTKTFPLTIKNYTGGKIEITIKSGALTDTSGNTSASKTYTIITDKTAPTWASSVSDRAYSSSAKTYSLNLVGTDETELDDSSTLSGKITVKVGRSSTTNYTLGTATLSSDKKTKTFPLTIKSYTGGTISITASAGALVDTAGNTSSSKTYSFTPDITAPTWANDVSGGTWSTSAKTYALNLVGSDETGLNDSSSKLTTGTSRNLTVKVEGTVVSASNLTLGSTSLSSDSKTKTFPLTIKNYTGGKIEITIKSGALVDTSTDVAGGNKSAEKTYTIITDKTAPVWADNVSDGTYSASASTYALNLVGTDEIALNDSSSTISGKITVKVNGSTVNTNNLTIGSGTLSSDKKTKTFPLTIKSYTGGTISITVSAGALVDTAGNTSSAKTYSFTPDTTAPTWADSVSGGTWSTSGKTYALNLVGSDETGLNSSSSTLSTSKVTVKVGGTAVSSSNLTFGTTSLSSDSKTKTFPLTIKNYIGGKIEITINAGALVDTSGNTSASKTYTITTDSTVPTWADDVSGETYSASAKTFDLELVGTDDKYLNDSSSTLSGKITVKANGSTVNTNNLTVGSGTLSSDGTTKTFPLTIKNYTGGPIEITISAGALVDTGGNTSASKTYSFTPDTTAPVWADDISGGTFSLSAKTYKFNVVGSDEKSLNSSASTLTKGTSGNISITVDGVTVSTSNITLGTATTSGNTKTFPITLNNFTGGTVKVTISAGALKDNTGNESAQKVYEFWVDGERPVWADNIIDGTYDADAKTYSLKFQGTDNDALASTTLSSSNVKITATDKNGNTSTLNNLSFGSVTTSADSKTKTFPLTINNFPGGDIKITISAGALKDVTGNESGPNSTVYEFSVDGVSPTWDGVIYNGRYTKPTTEGGLGTYYFELKGSDDVGLNSPSSVLSSSNVSITVGGSTVSSSNLTFGNATLNDATKTFPITISNFTGGEVKIVISANALVDTSGNKSARTEYDPFTVDITAPLWDEDIVENSYNSSSKEFTVTLRGTDEVALNGDASVLNASTIDSITLDGTAVDWEIKESTLVDSKTKTFKLVIKNLTNDGTVRINIKEGALVDAAGNVSAPKEYSFAADVTPPQWKDATGVYNPDDQSYTITVTGEDNVKLNNVSSKLTVSNTTVTVGGTKVTPTITTTSTSTTSETYTLKWSNHTGGAVVLKINAGALVDAATNTSAYKEYTFSEVDATKPVWNASISNAQYTLANDTDEFGTFTFDLIGTDETALDNAKSLLDGKLTITTDGSSVSSDDITIGTPTFSADSKTKTFPISVKNFKGGNVVITISSGALVDTTGNKSNSISYTFFRDVTKPVWDENISEAIYNPTTKQYSFELVGSDEYALDATNSVLTTTDPANITITLGEGASAITPSFTIGTATVSGNTKKFPISVDFTNYTVGERVTIRISKYALIDTAGNKSIEKTYSFIPDITAPVWSHENIAYNPDDVSYSVELVGTDAELDTTLSTLVASGSSKNVTVKCGSTTVTPTLTKLTTSSTEIRYKLTINNYPGGVVTITIGSGALIDVAKNESIETTITLDEKDITKPTLTAQNPEYSSADKTYTFEIVASDNLAIDDTTSSLSANGNGKNVTITCAGGDIQPPTISIKEITETQIIYQVTIQNYPAGVVNVSIDAGAIRDTTGNKNVATNLTLPALDIANPYWEEQKPAVEYDEDSKTVNLSLVGKDETSLNDSESTLTLGSNIIIYADGQPISSSKVVFGTPTISSDQLTKTFPLTINNFTGGILEISIGSGALKDNSGKVSDAKTYTFSDIIKPKWTIEPKGTYDRDNNIYTVTLNASDDISLATADLASNLTVLVDGDGDGTGTAVTPTVTLTSDGETQKTYTVAIPNYLGGTIELLIAEGALTDDEGNRSKETYFAYTPDITPPVWEVGNVAFESETENTDTIIIDLYGSDNVYLTDSSLVKNNITVQFGDVIIDRADIELTGPESSADEKGGVIYQLRISGYTGEDITLIISPDTLTDDSGNKSVRTTITSEAIIPDSDNDVPTVSNVSHAVDAINGVVTVDFDIRDSWYNFKDLIEAGEYTISAKNYSSSGTMWGSGSYSSVDVSSATITVVKQIRLAKGYHYRIKIEGLSSILRTGTAWEQSGWQWTQVTKYPLLTVTLNANAATDLFNKGNVVTNLLQDQEIDFTVSDGAASLSLKAVSLNKSLKAMYIDLHATWTSSGYIWGSGSGGNTDFTLTSDMITGLTIDGESIIDFIKEEGADRLQITNGTTSSSSSSTGNWWGSSTTVYNKDLRITLLDFIENTRQSGKEYLEWSGNVGLTLSSGSTSYLFEEETYATENADNVLFADLINPEIEVVSSTINDEDINSVTVRVKATDKYFVPNAVFNTDKVKVTLDGEYPTEEQNISISFGTEDELFGMRNGVSEQYGIVQDITITGLADKLDQRIQLRLETGAIADLSGNVNATKKITLFNFLKDTSTETTATSAFLGITDTSGNAIPRQNIESVQFLNTTASAPSQVASVTDGVFDVSAEQDGSILAWYTGSGPYQVYIASNNPIYANPNSSYLFSYIGSGTSCTNTSIFSNLNLLNTRFTTNMSYMFNNCGSAKMTSLDLGAFDTSRAENMTGMFQSCGNTAMTSLNLGTAFKTDKVTNMSNMFNGCGQTAMTTLTLGDNFDTTNVQNMSGMFQNCGKTAMTSLDLGEKFYTTSATDMSNMFNGCGNTAMTSLDLGPAFTRIASTNTGFATNCGKSGTVQIYVGSSIYSSKSAFKLDADSSTTISYTTGTIIPKYKPEWTKTYAAYDADNQKLTVRLEGKVNTTNYANAIQTVTNNFSNGVLTEDSVFANQIIKVRIDGEEASTIQKELSMVVKGPADTVTCEIILTNFVQTSMQTGKSYFEWAGNVALQIAEEMLVDGYGNRSLEQSDEVTGTMQRVEIKDDATTDHMVDTMMFADFVKPVITYEYSEADINKTAKTAKIVFNITDKYYASESLSLENLTILMDGTNLKQTPVEMVLDEEDIIESGKTVGRKYTLTLSELQQNIIATGKSYLDFSGPVTIAVPAGAVTDKSGNTNIAKTITVGVDEKTYTDNTDENSAVVVDVVDPIWTNVENGVTLDFANNRATVKVKATDKYFDKDNCTLSNSDIKFYLDGVETTTGITISVSTPTLLQETRMVNGVSTSVDIGAEYTITITGITLNYDQAKLKIVAGTITDLNGNTSAENEVILYNRLKSAETETSATSGFLGNSSIQRQDIQKVEFVSGIAGSQDEGVQQVWDVSAVGDGSIKAWTKQTTAPYTVYIGSEGGILANRNSSYLFAHIGYGSSCTATEVIKNLNLLDTSSVTNMTAMFKNCGYQKMTSLDLGSNFYTSNVTNMSSMFEGCGYTAMTTFSFGSNFVTTNVTNMSGMFQNFGQKITSLDLSATGVTFNTANVTDMSNMFNGCGQTLMTALTLGSSFNTVAVTNMSGMFKNCGYEAMTSLNLGNNFNTSAVQNMSSMFEGCGHNNMTTLTLGSNFNTSAVTNMNSMFKECGASKLDSLSLGGLFYTTNVTDMTSMFNGCGQVLMTTLDLGPAFTKIASTNTDFATNCGKADGITVYVGSAIYSNENEIRLDSTSSETIGFTRGTINPKYKPEWTIGTSNVSGTSLVITLEGKVDSTNYGSYTKTVTNKFANGTTALVNVSIDGDSTANEQITKTISGVSSTPATTVTCTLTLTDFEAGSRNGKPFDEWSGDVTLGYLPVSLTDSYGNPNLEQVDNENKAYIDVIKPSFTYEYYETEINTNTSIVTVYFSITDKYFASIDTTKLTADNITVKVDDDATTNSAITKTLTKVEDVLYGTDNTKIGEKYKLVIEGLDKGDGVTYSGPMTLAFVAGVAKDQGPNGDGTNPNTSDAKTITIGIDDPSTGDGHNSSVIVDVVDPIWKVENLTATTADLIATDKYLSTYPTAAELKSQMQVKIGETDVTNQITITGPTAVTNGQKYSLTIPEAVADGQPESYDEFLAARSKYANGEDGGRLYREATSGAVKVIIPKDIIADTSGNTNIVKEFSMGNANDVLKPETVKVSSTKDTTNKTETIIFDVTDKYFAQMNYSTIELKDKIHVLVDGEETTTVTKDLQLLETLTATIDGSTQTIGKRYKLVLSDFATPTDGKGLENGYDFKGLSGTVSIEIDEGIATDQSGNTSSGRKTDGTNTSEGQPMVGDFVDFINPDVIYRHSETNIVENASGEKEVQIVFDVADKYYSSGTLTADDLTIMIQDGTDDTNYINIRDIPGVQIGLGIADKIEEGPFNKTVSGSVQSVTNQVIGKTYTLTISNLEQAEIATGRNYLDYSGNVTIGIPANKVSDTSGNQNVSKSITMGIDLPEETGSKEVLDIVRPVWSLESQSVDIDKQEATITIKGTDKYFSGSSLTANNVELYIDGTKVTTNDGTSGRSVSIESTTPIYEDWTIDGATSQVQIGVTYVIKITGFEVNAEQAKVKIPAGTLTDTSGNTSEELETVLYSCLMSATGETQATTGNDATRIFLGNPHNIQRQNIECITFVSSLADANSTKWDVSAVQDGSIMAWYTGTGPYKVYIGSNGGIFANLDSSYLFSYIGYASTCTATTPIVSLNLLETGRIENMSYMFAYCGAQKMTSLNLGNDFDTSNVTNMSHMFEGCGQTAMTSLNLGDNFNTSKVQDMSYMFQGCGENSTTFTSLDLSASASATTSQKVLKFDTSSVTNMANMFANCGKTAMTSLNLGDNFNTENVQNMSAMFQNCGGSSTTFTSLDLGDLFNTKSATNMSNMFNGCGQTAMTALDLGAAFTKIASTNTNFATNCGVSGAVIYAPEAIYKNRTAFKTSSTDTTGSIAVSSGRTINPIYKPEWTKVSSSLDTTTDPSNPKINIVIKGSASKSETINGVNINYSSEVTATLAYDDITVYIDGEEATNIAKLVSLESESATGSEVEYKITLSGFEETLRQSGKNFKEWSGNIAIKIGGRGQATGTYTANILKDDTYGNQSMMETDESGSWIDVKIKDADTDRNTSGTMFADFIKPEYTYEYANTTIDHGTKTVTVVFDITDKYFENSSFTEKDITIAMIGDETSNVNVDVTKTLTLKTIATDVTDGTTGITYKTDGSIYYNGQMIGQRYELVLEGLEQLDENGLPNGYTYSGPMSIALPSGTLNADGTLKVGIIDNSGNLNSAKTITIGIDETDGNMDTDENGSQQVVDVVDPIWEMEQLSTDEEAKTATIKITGKDKYFKESTLTADKIKIYVNGVESTSVLKNLSTPTDIKETVDGVANTVVGKEYILTLSNLEPTTGGTGDYVEFTPIDSIVGGTAKYRDENGGNMTIEIEAGTIEDKYQNFSNVQDFTMGIIDATMPEVYEVQKTKDTSAKTETIIFNVTDKNYDSTDLVEKGEITVFVDGDQVDFINKSSLTSVEIKTTIDGETKIVGHQYTLVLDGFISDTKNANGYDDWSGTVSIQIATNASKDTKGNTLNPDTTTISDFIDFLKPQIEQVTVTEPINATNKTYTFKFTAIDKYMNTSDLITEDEIKVYVDGVEATTVDKALSSTAITKTFKKTVDGTVTEGNYTIGHEYTLVLSGFEETDAEFTASGRNYKEWSGNVSIEVLDGAVKDKGPNGDDINPNVNDSTQINGDFVDFIKPKIEQVSSSKNTITKTETILINVMDKYLDTSDELTAGEITVYVDGEDASSITKTLTKVQDFTTIVNGSSQIVGQQYKLELTNFDQGTNNAKGYKDYSGTVSIDIVTGAVKDRGPKGDSSNPNTSEPMTMVGDYVDFITPYITYEYLTSDIDRMGTDADGKSFQMVFTVTDKYYTSGELSIDDLSIRMDDGKNTYNLKEEPVTIKLVKAEDITASNVKMTNETTGAIETVASTTIGHKYILTISNLEELEIKSDNTTLDYSGIVTVTTAADVIFDRSRNANVCKAITSGVSIPDETADPVVVDVVQPIWRRVAGSSIDLTNQTATIVVNGTDTYYASNSLTASGIKVYAYTGTTATDITSSVNLQLSAETTLNESVTINETTSTRQYGVQYTISLTGIPTDKDQVKVVIPAGTLTDQSGNTNNAYEIKLYTTLKSAASETEATSAFLGNSNIQRQNIESITFVDSTSGAESNKWDVSAVGDNSIIAWYTGSGPYQVYIGSDEFMCANKDSSYLFSYIGYASTCEATSVINGLEILNTMIATDMNHMFQYCGYQKMETLSLGSNFNTTNVTNMSGMFQNCGQTGMTSLNLGNKFYTSKVTDMSNMFNGCGQAEMTSFSLEGNFNTAQVTNMSGMFKDFAYKLADLSLGDQFYTSEVTDMSNMFNGCGQTEMTSLTLGDNFNTSQVTNMSGMFQDLGKAKMQSFDLGNTFYTTAVTNMTNMFNGCGQSAMTVLDLGPAFTKIADSHDNFMTNCGTSELVIYAPEAIYSDRTSFKLN